MIALVWPCTMIGYKMPLAVTRGITVRLLCGRAEERAVAACDENGRKDPRKHEQHSYHDSAC